MSIPFDAQVASGKTALTRTRVSAPLQWLLDHDLIKGWACNWGEGKALVDTDAMDERTGYAIGYDPNTDAWYLPEVLKFDTIYCGYVLNTLDAWHATDVSVQIQSRLRPGGIAYIAVRLDEVAGEPYRDGVITKRGTFQVNYSQFKFITYIHKTSHYGIYTIRSNHDLPMS